MPCFGAKTALFISLFITVSSFSKETYPCGSYRGRGSFFLNQQNHFVFTLRPGTYSPREFLVLGGKAEEKLEKLSSDTEIEFYIPNPISSSNRSWVFLKSFPTKNEVAREELWLVKSEACGKKP